MTGRFGNIVRRVIWYFPFIVAAPLCAMIVRWFSDDMYFVLVAILTLLVLTIIVHWSWTIYIDEQPWHQREKERQS